MLLIGFTAWCWQLRDNLTISSAGSAVNQSLPDHRDFHRPYLWALAWSKKEIRLLASPYWVEAEQTAPR